MRVWIISDKRYGDSEEVRWIASWAMIDPKHVGSGEFWDHVRYVKKTHATEAAAMSCAARAVSNVCTAASVYSQALERVENDSYDWVNGTPIEVECQYREPVAAS